MWEYYANLYEETRQTNFFVTTDIDEAIFLADRLIIMTNIPTQVAQVIEVNIPRPRSLRTLFESDYVNDLKSQVLKILHTEAMKSFKGGSKAAADFIDAVSKRTESNPV
jgi:NitT/TauT family transport system ATP-binding protein